MQQTIANPILIEGIGLHSGKAVKMALLPGSVNSGILFISKQGSHKVKFKASPENIRKTTLCTSLGIRDSSPVDLVEHLLAALYGMGVDNLVVRLDDTEVPILDGSALPFISAIKEAGLVSQNAPRKSLAILKKLEIEEDGKSISVSPYAGTRITYTIDYKNRGVGRQTYDFIFSKFGFANEIAPARTFGFLNEVETLQKNGLALGGSLQNAVVIGPEGILNSEGLRFPDEFVRHKILDLIGDFSLLGYDIQGHIIANCAGHALHAKLMHKMLQNKKSCKIIEIDEKRPQASEVPTAVFTLSSSV